MTMSALPFARKLRTYTSVGMVVLALFTLFLPMATVYATPLPPSQSTASTSSDSSDLCYLGVDLLSKLKRAGRARVVIPRNHDELRANSDLAEIRKTTCTTEHDEKIAGDLNSRVHLGRKWVTYEDKQCETVFEPQCIHSTNIYPAYSKRAVLKSNANIHQCADVSHTCQPVKTWTLVLQRVCRRDRLVFVMRPFEYTKTYTCQPDPSLAGFVPPV